MRDFLKIFPWVKPYKTQAILNIFFNVLAVVFNLVSLAMIIPFLRLLFELDDKTYAKPEMAFSVQTLIDYFNYYLSHIIQNNSKTNALLFICGIVLLVFLFKNLFFYLARYVMAPLRHGVAKDLRNTLYQKILRLPLSYFSEERKGDLMSRMTTDVNEVEHSILNALILVFREPVHLLVFLAFMFWISPGLTIFVLLFLPLSGFLISKVGASLKRASRKGQKQLGILNAFIEESLSGLRIIKAFNASDSRSDDFQNENEKLYNVGKKMLRRRDLASPLSEFLGITVVVTVLWYGGSLVLNQQSALDAESFIAYILVFSQMINPAKSLSNAVYHIQQGLASMERIEAVLDAEELIKDHAQAISKGEFIKSITFDNVSFSYEEQQTIKALNFTVSKGETVALVGPSGAGKSTVADLICRFYDVKDGGILLDGEDIRKIKLKDLRNLIGVVTQQAILFNDSVFNNIAFGIENPSKEKVIEAAKIANAHNFIMALPDGYETNIGEAGNKLSGGEKQRITIARAVFKNPPILILDEATSSLDTESEQLVQEALNKLMQNRTSVVIAHRLSTVHNADKILVIKKGELSESGTHPELIQEGGLYKKLVEMQALSTS